MTALRLVTDDIDIAATLAPLAVLAGDPTIRLAPGLLQRATWTPDGPGTIAVTWQGSRLAGSGGPGSVEVTASGGSSSAEVTAYGPGASWLLDRADRLVGLADDSSGFDPAEPPLRQLWRRHHGTCIPATGTLWHDLAWTVVQQRIHRRDAADQWRRFVLELGTAAEDGSDLMSPPDPRTVARLQYHHLHRLGIERQRADYLIDAARAILRLQQLVDEPVGEALPHLRGLRGVGPWTSACLSAFTWGAQDTVIVGDSGIPSMITWLLAKEPRGDDARMLRLLDPYRPHRYRARPAAGVRRQEFSSPASALRRAERHPSTLSGDPVDQSSSQRRSASSASSVR